MQARETLLSQGKHPSIDAVRVVLGNTGSKSTIHRYLREIEQEMEVSQDSSGTTRLSQPLTELVGRLADTLQQEAKQAIELADQQHQQEQLAFSQRLGDLNKENQQLQQQLQACQKQLAHTQQERDQALTDKQAVQQELNTSQQHQARLAAVEIEQQKQIESLEEKHRHSREALNHYRDSAQQQREQDIRQHEQQRQQLQVEIRALQQTISVQQTSLSQLNNQNGQLQADYSHAQQRTTELQQQLETLRQSSEQTTQQLTSTQQSYRQLQLEHDQLQNNNQQLKQQYQEQQFKAANDSQTLNARIDEEISRLQQAQLEITALKAQVTSKDEMLERLLDANKKARTE